MIGYPTETARFRGRGTAEALLSLPLLLLLAWGVATVGGLLLQRSRTESAAWASGAASSHRASREEAEEAARRSLGAAGGNVRLERAHDCSSHTPLGTVFRELPLSFRAAIGGRCAGRDTIVFTTDRGGTEVEFLVRGDDFRHSRSLRQALWQEAMSRAGFGALPLQALALSELSDLFGVDLGGAAREVLGR